MSATCRQMPRATTLCELPPPATQTSSQAITIPSQAKVLADQEAAKHEHQ